MTQRPARVGDGQFTASQHDHHLSVDEAVDLDGGAGVAEADLPALADGPDAAAAATIDA